MPGDVHQVQTDIVSLWSESARMILEVETRAHVDQLAGINSQLGEVCNDVSAIKAFTSDAAQAARRAELELIKDAVGKVMLETVLGH